jgi:hypothetical protein
LEIKDGININKMPVRLGEDKEGSYAAWGQEGKHYYYTKGNSQSLAIAKSKANAQGRAINASFAESYTDYPQAASEAAQRALDWAEENGWGDCGTPVGKIRANQLAKREPISRDTIARMAAFARHLQWEGKEFGDGCGSLMLAAWGNREGIEWAQRKLKEIDNGN